MWYLQMWRLEVVASRGPKNCNTNLTVTSKRHKKQALERQREITHSIQKYRKSE